ncbi:MAG: sugar ABC transporter substrate-binding protein [Sphaerochaetaceae bacterium]|nr:sugar ABC transporter substrate-binding protein [Sphaerochaetaceae bacterium]
MKSFKIYFVMVLVLLSSGILFASGQKEESGEKVLKLVGWSTTPQEKEYVQSRIDLFEAENPNVKVEWEILANEYNETLQIQIASGKGPDVFYLDASWASMFIENYALSPIDDYISQSTIDGFYPSTLDAFRDDSNLYGLAKDMNTLVLYYDELAFEKYGMSVPTTWDELLETSKTFAAMDEYEAGIVLRTDFARFYPFILQNGGSILDEDGNPNWTDKAVVDAFDYYFNDLIGSGAAKTNKDFNGENEGALTTKKVPMMISGGWATAYLNENGKDIEWKMTKLPKGKSEKTVLFTVAYVMNKNANDQELAASFIDFMTSEKSQRMVVDSGLAVPTRQAVADYYIEKNPTLGANPEQAKNAKVYNLGVHTPKIADLMSAAGDKIRLQGMSAQQALEEAELEFNEYLDTL